MADTHDNDPNNITQGAIEPDTEPNDESFAESTTSSYCTSIASEIRNGRIENGRVYASYGQNEYGLPVDKEELDRIDMNHAKYTLLQENKLFLAPLPPDPQNILDIGTGTGIFAIEVAEKFPEATVVGTDIAPMQATWVPPNCSFEIEDAEAEWPYNRDSFDYIHGRDLYHSIRDWPKMVQQAYTHLKPGGYFELACVLPNPKSDDNTLPTRSNSAFVEVCATFQEIAAQIGASPDAPLSYRSWMEDAGFVDVNERVFKIPTSPWPRDKRLKRVGAFELINVMEGAQAALLRGYTTGLGRTREELEALLGRMRKELLALRFHSYVSFVVVYGMKPRT